MRLIAIGIALLCVSCTSGNMDGLQPGQAEFVWGQRRIIGFEVPLGGIKPGLGIWVSKEAATAVPEPLEVSPMLEK